MMVNTQIRFSNRTLFFLLKKKEEEDGLQIRLMHAVHRPDGKKARATEVYL
jgi:hypothetical protein